MIARLYCKLFGHRRGIRIERPETETMVGLFSYRCPRCGASWSRKAKPARLKAAT